LWTMPTTKILIFNLPNFKLARSMGKIQFWLSGRN
jgi:hypothetical protein